MANPILIVSSNYQSLSLFSLQECFEDSNLLKGIELKNEDDLILYQRRDNDPKDVLNNAHLDIAEDSSFHFRLRKATKYNLQILSELSTLTESDSCIENLEEGNIFIAIKGGNTESFPHINQLEAAIYFALVTSIAKLQKGCIVTGYTAEIPTARWFPIDNGVYEVDAFEKIGMEILSMMDVA